MELLIPVGGVVAALLIAAVIFYIKSIRFAGPNEAMLITGTSSKAEGDTTVSGETVDQSRVVINSRVFVNPVTERVHYIDLSSRQVEVNIEAISNNGIQLKLTGVAQVKVGGDPVSVRKAAQRFLDQQDAIDHYTQETLSGSLRSIVGTLTVDAIIKDRAAFALSVKEEAEHSMNNQGLVIDTFQIKAVDDPSGYLKNLGRPEAAAVARNADIAEANAHREAAEARALAEQKVAESEQKLAIRRAELKEETDARQAVADAAGPLAEAAQKEAILVKEQHVVAREAELRERQLDVEVRKPADAAKYKVETEAAADLEKRRRAAEATKIEAAAKLENRKYEADGDRAVAEAQAAAEKARGEADAEVTKAKGNAEAETIKAKGVAEAAGIAAQAEAYEKYNEAAVLNKVLEVLPAIAKEIAAPMGAIDNLTVISNDGASQLSKNVAGGVQQTAQMLKDATGFDVIDLLKNFGKNGGTTEEAASSVVGALKSGTSQNGAVTRADEDSQL
jgi:flotillin